MYFDDFHAKIGVVDWPKINQINSKLPDCLSYLGNHLGEDGKAYAVFSGAGIIRAVKLHD